MGLVAPSQRLNLITTELEEGVMKTRMQPIGNIWSKFPRTVRDVATMCGKQVRIEMEGKETELDKTIIEAIKDPLTHIARNSVDHGIEPPAKRVAANKNVEGRLLLRAYHEGGQVIIEISPHALRSSPLALPTAAPTRLLNCFRRSPPIFPFPSSSSSTCHHYSPGCSPNAWPSSP